MSGQVNFVGFLRAIYYPMDLQVFVSIVSLWFCVAAAVYTRMSEGVCDGGPPAKKTSCK